MRAVRYEGGRDAIMMMTLVLSVLQMSKSLTYISCTLITLKRACCNCRRSCLLAAALGVSEQLPRQNSFYAAGRRRTMHGWKEGRKAQPNEHTTSGIGMNREVVFGFRNSPWLPLICIPISNRISHDDRGERADSTRPDSRFSFTVTARLPSNL